MNIDEITTETTTEDMYIFDDDGNVIDESLVVHEYITTYPLAPLDYESYKIQVKQYNITLLLVWLILLMYGMDKIFVVFQKLYRK